MVTRGVGKEMSTIRAVPQEGSRAPAGRTRRTRAGLHSRAAAKALGFARKRDIDDRTSQEAAPRGRAAGTGPVKTNTPKASKSSKRKPAPEPIGESEPRGSKAEMGAR